MVVKTLDKTVFWIELDRPDKLNSFDSKTLIELREAVKEGCNSPASLVAIVGKGRLFSSGMDLGEVASAKSPGEVRELFEKFVHFLEAVVSCRGRISGVEAWKPVIVFLNGPAVAGGAELVLAADIAIAVKDAWLQWPELRWGLIAPMLAGFGSIGGWPRIAYIGLSMKRISALDAYQLGLISEIVEDVDEGRQRIRELALILTEGGGRAVEAYLSNLRRTKMKWLEHAKQLVDLAEREDFIIKAREFLSRKR